MDFRGDESYTPAKLLVRAGNSVQELKVTAAGGWGGQEGGGS